MLKPKGFLELVLVITFFSLHFVQGHFPETEIPGPPRRDELFIASIENNVDFIRSFITGLYLGDPVYLYDLHDNEYEYDLFNSHTGTFISEIVYVDNLVLPFLCNCTGLPEKIKFSINQDYPLFFVIFVENLERADTNIFFETFGILPFCNDPDDITVTEYHDIMIWMDCLMLYDVIQYTDFDSNIVHIHFMAYYTQSPYVVPPDNINYTALNNTDFGEYVILYEVSGNYKNIMLGQIMFSNDIGYAYNESEIRDLLFQILNLTCPIISSDLECCDRGVLVNRLGQEPLCNCTPGWTGVCCDSECIHGDELFVGPNNISTCRCHKGWGGDHCDEINRALQFVDAMDAREQICGEHVPSRFPYLYDVVHNSEIIVEGPILRSHMVLAVDDEYSGEFAYGVNGSHAGVNYYSSIKSDMIFAAWIDNEDKSAESFTLETYTEISPQFTNATTYTGTRTRGDACEMRYLVRQTWSEDYPGSIMQFFFAVGGWRYAEIPDAIRFETYEEGGCGCEFPVRILNNIFTLTSFPSKLLMGMHVVISDNESPNEIPTNDLLNVLDCIMETACPIVSHYCTIGANVIEVGGNLGCTCKGGWSGVHCRWPDC